MLIDWYTVVAQALNFLILVWLLKRFAYRPILDAINAREQKIAAQMSAAAAAQAAATAERAALERKTQDLEQHRAAALDEVMQEVAATRSRLLGQVRQDADSERSRLYTVLSTEWAQLRGDVTAKLRSEALDIASQALQDLAGVSLNDALTQRFINQLGHISESDRMLLQDQKGPLLIRSAYDFTSEARARIQAVVAKLIPGGTELQFSTAADLICGVELQAAGYQWAWSVRHYLEDLQASIDAILQGQAMDKASRSKPASAAAP